jgi:hypothetical protein
MHTVTLYPLKPFQTSVSIKPEIIFLSIALQFPKENCFLNIILLVGETCRYRRVLSNGGMILTGETEVLGEKHYKVLMVDG